MAIYNKHTKLIQVIGQPPAGDDLEVYVFPLTQETKEIANFLKGEKDCQWRDVVHYPCNCGVDSCGRCSTVKELKEIGEWSEQEIQRDKIWFKFWKVAIKYEFGKNIMGRIVRTYFFKE